MPVKPTKEEKNNGEEGKNKFIQRCRKKEQANGYKESTAYAICYRYWREATEEDNNNNKKEE